MTEYWHESFEKHEETIRKIAQDGQTQLADDFQQLIEEYENE